MPHLIEVLCTVHESKYRQLNSLHAGITLTINCVQVFVSTEVAAEVGGLKAMTSTGTSILVQGTLRRTPEGTLQVCFTIEALAFWQLLFHIPGTAYLV